MRIYNADIKKLIVTLATLFQKKSIFEKRMSPHVGSSIARRNRHVLDGFHVQEPLQ